VISIATIKKVDPRHQFSKRLARYGAIVWGIYSFAVLALVAYRPEVAMMAVYLTIIMTLNKAWDTYNYNSNSKLEKILLAILDKTKMEISLGGINAKSTSVKNDDEEDGEGDNG